MKRLKTANRYQGRAPIMPGLVGSGSLPRPSLLVTQAVSKRFRIFLRAKVVGLDDLSRRIFQCLGYLRQERVYGPDVAVLGGDSAGYGRKLRPASARDVAMCGMELAVADDCKVARKAGTKPCDIGGGDGGGKAVGRREGALLLLGMSRTQGRNRHVTEAARPRIGAA